VHQHIPELRTAVPRAGRRIAAAVATIATAAALAVAAPVAAGAITAEPQAAAPAMAAADSTRDELGSRFTLAILPDTQFYSRYSASQFHPRYGSDPFITQTRWLAEHADELRIPFVAHLGDVVDQVGQEGEWVAADAAMSVLEDAQLPYSVLAGNHDVRNSDDRLSDIDYDLANEPFLRWFSAERAAGQSTYGGSDATGMSTWHVFEAEEQQFMVLALPWRASEQTIAWANGVIDAHPELPVILTTHSLIDIENDGVTAKETDYGLKLWDELIAPNDQIFLTLNGHFHGAARQTKLNDFGHEVTQVVIDYQMSYDGGNGYLGLYEFDLSGGGIHVQTASPWVVSKDPEVLTAYDQPFLENAQQQFTIPIDFAQRFAGFAPGFGAGTPDEPNLSEEARRVLLDGFTPPEGIETAPPASTGDYARVDGTLAHWRFNGLDGVLAEGATVPDVAGGADLHRVPIAESGSPTAQVEDVTISHDAHPLSSDGAAVCFADSDQVQQRFSYLATDADAAVNDAKLENGYTIETFLKIDEAFTEDANGWMKAIVRSGNRSRLPGMPWSRWDYTASPVALGLSNLKEFQWSEVPVETTKGDRTAWSGEIILGRWVHVALVNDPADHTTTMYVDGAPVLRNTTDTLGHSLNGDMPWIFGADWVDDAARNGWHGCIGETRVVDHATTPDEWLTARADLGGVGVDLEQGASVKHLAQVSGTGIAGATVTVEVAPETSVPGAPRTSRGTAVVGEDGTWTVALEAPVRKPGAHRLTAAQTLGDRTGEPVEIGFVSATGRP
jgi:hypothetical protein